MLPLGPLLEYKVITLPLGPLLEYKVITLPFPESRIRKYLEYA
jgi:hypothetical protein